MSAQPMDWIALLPAHADERPAWGWHALQFTPRVARLDEALLLEISACTRLWGGRRRLLHRLLQTGGLLDAPQWANGGTALAALAMLRLQGQGKPAPSLVPDGLPLDVLSAAREHVPTLARAGCRTWGDVQALPRAGVARRFGADLLRALDAAWGVRPEIHPWLELPPVFDVKVELPALATSAPELLWSAHRLLAQLQVWLQARHLGLLALELEWTLDLRRLNGKQLPPTERMELRTAQPAQDMAHLRRLAGEQLARASIAAPASDLRLRSLQTVPWPGASQSLLPEDNPKGERLHQLVERLSVRLGEHNVLVPVAQEDHRPECMQRWVPARQMPNGSMQARGVPHSVQEPPAAYRSAAGNALAHEAADALYPPWLLPQPLPLQMKGDVPQYGGPLRRLVRLRRVETAWWDEGRAAFRDYFIASSEGAGLVWIYRERHGRHGNGAREDRWFLQGLYA